MNKELYELVLIDSKGRVVARVLELASKEYAEDLAERWNKDRHLVNGQWKVSQMERLVI